MDSHGGHASGLWLERRAAVCRAVMVAVWNEIDQSAAVNARAISSRRRSERAQKATPEMALVSESGCVSGVGHARAALEQEPCRVQTVSNPIPRRRRPDTSGEPPRKPVDRITGLVGDVSDRGLASNDKRDPLRRNRLASLYRCTRATILQNSVEEICAPNRATRIEDSGRRDRAHRRMFGVNVKDRYCGARAHQGRVKKPRGQDHDLSRFGAKRSGWGDKGAPPFGHRNDLNLLVEMADLPQLTACCAGRRLRIPDAGNAAVSPVHRHRPNVGYRSLRVIAIRSLVAPNWTLQTTIR
jgi:hypothetical protein